MKLSEVQKILKEYEDKYGDIEIDIQYSDNDEHVKEIRREDFAAVSEDPEPNKILYINLWV
jgi:hypothetical protein